MPTLILSSRYSADSIALRKTALQKGWHVERIYQRANLQPHQFKNPVLYGETIFVQMIAEALNLSLSEPESDWLTTVPTALLKRDLESKTLGEIRQRQATLFIKPAIGKPFESRVYSSEEPLPSAEYFPDDTPVLVSEPVQWQSEYRFFVAQQIVKTGSIYLRDGELVETWESEDLQAAIAFTQSVLDVVPFAKAAVLDVGQIKGRGWAVIEANPAWASGIYGCDPSSVLEVLAHCFAD